MKELITTLILSFTIFSFLAAQGKKEIDIGMKLTVDSISYFEPITFSIQIKNTSGKRLEIPFMVARGIVGLEYFDFEKKSWNELQVYDADFRLIHSQYMCRNAYPTLSSGDIVVEKYAFIPFFKGEYLLKNEKQILLRAKLNFGNWIDYYRSNTQLLKIFEREKEKEAVNDLMSMKVAPSIVLDTNVLEEDFKVAKEFLQKNPNSYYANYARKTIIYYNLQLVQSSIGYPSGKNKEERFEEIEEQGLKLLRSPIPRFRDFAEDSLWLALDVKSKMSFHNFHFLLEIEKLEALIEKTKKASE